MDPAVLLRIIHDLQVRIFELEAQLEKALAPQVSLAEQHKPDAEVR